MGKIIMKGGSDYANIPPATIGAHDAVCCEIYDRGVVKDATWGNKHKAWIIFQVKELIEGTESEYDGKRKEVRVGFNVGPLGPRSTARKVLESWRGGPMLQEEIDDGFDMDTLICVPARIVVGSHSKPDANGRMYANDVSINPPQDWDMVPTDYVPVDERKKAEDAKATEFPPKDAPATNGGASPKQGKVPF